MFIVHNDAARDLAALKATDHDAFVRLATFLKELQQDEYLLSQLLTHMFGDDRSEPIGVKKWLSIQRRENLPVWRIRVWELEKKGLSYRLVYFYYYKERTIYLLAVCHRDQLDYDKPSNLIRQRVVRRIRSDFLDA